MQGHNQITKKPRDSAEMDLFEFEKFAAKQNLIYQHLWNNFRKI